MPIQRIPLPPSKIGYSAGFEMYLVARHWGMRPRQFAALPKAEQAELIAGYRAEKRMEAVEAYKSHKGR